ncbi:MAG: 16S rRNA (cytidine(1402)-2'-O)-methyltransferase [Candidatus Gracilibacteria bacterium]|nr:16S rRNA (cytidine(1402)-2'-O)-methyltransferase [Candidatus Gracilibacteria bacterium]
MLYIVATPIGNLDDITYRAVKTLESVDGIACEDTRTSSTLLNHYGIKKPLISFHSHSGVTKVDKIIEQLKAGQNIALISDAGTPGISDPGYVLIKEAIINGIEVVPIPGVTAFTTALMGSGMQMNHFLYLGFLPVKKGRQTLLTRLSENKSETVVIYESVHRLLKTLYDLEKYFGSEHQIVVARELTKKFEEFKRGTVAEIKEYYEKTPGKLKGEFVIIF